MASASNLTANLTNIITECMERSAVVRLDKLNMALAKVLTGLSCLDPSKISHLAALCHLEFALTRILEFPDYAPWVSPIGWKNIFLNGKCDPLEFTSKETMMKFQRTVNNQAHGESIFLEDGSADLQLISESIFDLLILLGFEEQKVEVLDSVKGPGLEYAKKLCETEGVGIPRPGTKPRGEVVWILREGVPVLPRFQPSEVLKEAQARLPNLVLCLRQHEGEHFICVKADEGKAIETLTKFDCTLVMPARSQAGPWSALLGAAQGVLRDTLNIQIRALVDEAVSSAGRIDLMAMIDKLAYDQVTPFSFALNSRTPLSYSDLSSASSDPARRLLKVLGWKEHSDAPANLSMFCVKDDRGRVAHECFRKFSLDNLRNGFRRRFRAPTTPQSTNHTGDAAGSPPASPSCWPSLEWPLRDSTENNYYLEIISLTYDVSPGVKTAGFYVSQPKAGPCAIIAVANAILLGDSSLVGDAMREEIERIFVKITERPGRVFVRLGAFAEILLRIREYLFRKEQQRRKALLGKHLISDSLFRERDGAAKALAPAFDFFIKDVCSSTGMTIDDFYFDGTFPSSPSTSFFETFQCTLLHGWVPEIGDPMDALLSKFPRISEDSLRNLVAAGDQKLPLPPGISQKDLSNLRDFASSEPRDGMTPRGLELILERMRDNGVSIFYSQRQCVAHSPPTHTHSPPPCLVHLYSYFHNFFFFSYFPTLLFFPVFQRS